MKITKWTKLKKVLPLVNAGNIERLVEMVPEHPSINLFGMTIAKFAEIVDNEQEWIMTNIFQRERYALNAFGKLKSLKKQMEQLSNFINRYDIPATQEEKNAKNGIAFPTFIQSILCDLVEYFGLNSFEEAERYKLSDWLMIFQKRASQSLFEYRYNKNIELKNKAKSKRKH